MKFTKKSSLVASAVVAAVTIGGFGVANAAAPAHSSAKSVAVARPSVAGANATTGTNPMKAILDGLVTKGTITQAQEDAIVAAFTAAKPAPGVGGPQGGRNGFGPMGGPNQAAEQSAILTTLGITATTLQADLAAGQSLATIAGTKTQALITALVAVENTEIDAAVTAGHLTASQATTEKANVLAKVTAHVNATPGQGGMGGMGRGHGHGHGHGPEMGMPGANG